MRRKIPVKLRISGLGRSRYNKYPNRIIDGDLYQYNKSYKYCVDTILDWSPDKEIVDFVDKHKIKFKLIVKSEHVEIHYYYPRNFLDLFCFIMETEPNDNKEFIRVVKERDFKFLEDNL